MWTHPLRRLAIPVLLLIAAVVALPRLPQIPPEYLKLVDYVPYVMLGAALAFSAFFNRARFFTAALALLALYLVIRFELQTVLSAPRPLMIYSLGCAALPVAVLALLAFPERGLRNRYGMLLSLLVPLLVLLCWLALRFEPDRLLAFVQQWMAVRPTAGYLMSWGGSAWFLLSFAVSLAVLVKRDTEEAAAFCGLLLFSWATLGFLDRPRISAVMLGAAGLVLIVNLLRRTHEMAFRDELTGLLGRRAFNDRLKGLSGRYVIAMMDVDHFKSFNDTWGHDVGDDVLKMVAHQIARVRGGGTPYRYGGEEFSVIFSGKEMDECEPHLDELRSNIEHYRLAVRDTKHRKVPSEVAQQRRGRRKQARSNIVSVTISIGMAEPELNQETPEAVLKGADKALYKAKKGGRNRIAW